MKYFAIYFISNHNEIIIKEIDPIIKHSLGDNKYLISHGMYKQTYNFIPNDPLQILGTMDLSMKKAIIIQLSAEDDIEALTNAKNIFTLYVLKNVEFTKQSSEYYDYQFSSYVRR